MSHALSKPLSEYEKVRKQILEEKADGATKDFYKSLRSLRDERLYREEAATFEEYAQKRFGYSGRHVNRLIEAAHTKDRLGPNWSQTRPSLTSTVEAITSEGQLRELATVPDDKLEAVIEVAAKKSSGKKVSAQLLRESRQEVLGEEPKAAPKPKTPAPPELPTKAPEAVPYDELKEHQKHARKCMASLEAAIREADAVNRLIHPTSHERFLKGYRVMWEIARGWA